MSDVEAWSATDASNNAAPPDGFPEGMNRSDYNNAARAVMGAVRRFFNASEFVNLYANPARTVTKNTDTQIRIAGVDVTTDFPVDRRVQITDGSTTVSGFVEAAAFAAGDTLVTVLLDSGVVQAGANKVLVHSGKTLKRSAFRNKVPLDSVFDVKEDFNAVGDGTTNDATAIQNAIDAAEAAGGGTVFFPSGRYRVNTGLTVQASKVKLLGEGRFVSVLLSGSATAYMVTIGDNATQIDGVEIHDLGFTALGGVICTAGGALLFQKAPHAVVHNVAIYGTGILSGVPLWRGIDTNGTTGLHYSIQWSNIYVTGVLEDALRLQNAARALLSDIEVFEVGGVGLRIDTCDFSNFSNIWINGCAGEAGILLDDTFVNVPPSAGRQGNCVFANVMSSVNEHHGWLIRFCNLSTFVGCLGQFAQNNVDEDGFFLDSSAALGNVEDLVFSGCGAFDNDRHGFNLDTCRRVCIEACFSTRNSDGSAGGSGIRMKDCDDCTVSSNNVCEQAAGGTQKYGILIEGTSGATGPNLIQGNLSRGNVTKEFEDTSSGANLWRNNRGDDALPSVASAATVAIPNLTDACVSVTGTTTITNFSGHTHIGKPFTCRFVGALTVNHGTGIVLAGSANQAVGAGSRMTFAWDGTNYLELSRALA